VVLPVLAWHHASRQALPPHAAARLRPLASDVPGVDGPLIARMAAAMQRMRVRPPAGLLLHGPPGCGKSALAAAVARGAQMRLLVVDAALMLSKYVGDSEASIRALFRAARAASPCCLVIENVHVIGGVRAGGHGGEGEEGEAEASEGEGQGEEGGEGDVATGGESSADEAHSSDEEEEESEEEEGEEDGTGEAAAGVSAHAAAAGDDVASLSISVAGMRLSDVRVDTTETQPVPAAAAACKPAAPRKAAARSARARAIAAARLIAQAAPRLRKGRRQPVADAAPSRGELAATAAGVGASSAAAYAPAPAGARRGMGDGGRGSASIHDRMLATVLTELDGVGVRRTEKAGAAAGAAAAGGAGSPSAAAGDGLMDTESPLVLVIGITEDRAAIDPALLRPGRLDRHVHVGYPSAEDRGQLLRHALGPRSAAAPDATGGSAAELPAELRRLVAASAGFSTAEVLQLASRPLGV
jgi:SpoVK/Ycf46/Vps4 family AAA+-type ATPase